MGPRLHVVTFCLDVSKTTCWPGEQTAPAILLLGLNKEGQIYTQPRLHSLFSPAFEIWYKIGREAETSRQLGGLCSTGRMMLHILLFGSLLTVVSSTMEIGEAVYPTLTVKSIQLNEIQ